MVVSHPTASRSVRAKAARAAAYLTVLAGAVLCAAAAGAAPASAAVPVDFTVTFADLRPGETRTEARVVNLDRDAALVSAAWEQRTGLLASGDLAFTVCQASTCVASDSFVTTDMTAGQVEVAVTVTVPDDAVRGASGTALGRLTFVADDEHLAATGASSTAGVLWGVGLISVGGMFALLSTRRRSGSRDETGAR